MAATGWRTVAALGAAGSGVLHGGAALAHAGHGTGYVVFFTAAAGGQLALALLVRRRPHPALLLAAVLGTVALVAAYAAAQLGRLPAAGGHGHDGAGGPLLGLATVALELVTVAALPMLTAGRWRTALFDVALLGGVTLWGLVLA